MPTAFALLMANVETLSSIMARRFVFLRSGWRRGRPWRWMNTRGRYS